MTSEKVNKYRIGDWDVSLTSCTLSKGDVEVKVTPRSMDVLDCLAERHGEVVSHEELLGRFWQSTFTSDHAVHKVIAELRSALGDDAHQPRYIRTVPKRGYSLIAEVLRPQVPPEALPQTTPGLLLESRPRLARALLDKWVLGAVGAATVVLALFIRDADTKISNRDDVVRLAVLPFVNRGLNTENQFLTDGGHDVRVGLDTQNRSIDDDQRNQHVLNEGPRHEAFDITAPAR